MFSNPSLQPPSLKLQPRHVSSLLKQAYLLSDREDQATQTSSGHICNFSWWKCAFFSPSHQLHPVLLLSTSPPSAILPPQVQLPDNFHDKIVLFQHDTGPAACNVVFCLDPASSITLVDIPVPALARRDVWTSFDKDLLRKKKFSREATSEKVLRCFPEASSLSHYPAQRRHLSVRRVLTPRMN